MKTLLIFLVICSLFACTNEISFEDSTEEVAIDSAPEEEIVVEEIIEEEIEKTNNLIFNFDDFSFIIDNFDEYRTESIFRDIVKDSAFYSLDLGEEIEAQNIRIESIKRGTFKLFLMYENSITVSNEGPHCDLVDWKHYYSNWEEIENIGERAFKTKDFDEETDSRFVNINIAEVKQAVEDRCGTRWSNLLKDVKSVQDYPLRVSSSRAFIKIIFENGNETQEKIIVFEIPMGC